MEKASKNKIIHYLDEDFLKMMEKAGHVRPDDLVVEAITENGVVVLKFSHCLEGLPMLSSEARQLADTLNFMADVLDPPEEE